MNSSRDSLEELRAALAVNIFASEPHLREVLVSAISAAAIPWTCSDDLIDAARDEAVRCVISGAGFSAGILDRLAREVFPKRRDARHGIAKICAIGTSAIDRARWREIEVKSFKWIAIGKPLCDFSHDPLEGKVFPLDKGCDGVYPGSQYGCRCWGSPVIAIFDGLDD
jgi:hypothetical protein